MKHLIGIMNILEKVKFGQLKILDLSDNKISDKIINVKNYVDTQYSILDNRITQIEIGDIDIYDPTTGLLSPLQTVIDNLYDMNRGNAITASEYDDLELSATAYDAYDLTAREYDINAKSLLV